jgi:hypothetical protein
MENEIDHHPLFSEKLSEYGYFIAKRNNKTYISRAIKRKDVDGNEKKIHFVSRVFDVKEKHDFIEGLKEVTVRVTPGERQEVKALVYEDTRGIIGLTIQRFSINPLSNQKFKSYCTFIGKEIIELKQFIDSIAFLKFKENYKIKYTNEDLVKIREILEKDQDVLINLARENITEADVVAIGYRKRQLEMFEKLLNNQLFVGEYKKEHAIKKPGEEAAWQYFLSKNEWIFGYGLKYQFLNILTGQPNYGGTNFEGKGSQKGDFLMNTEAEKKFTVPVEIKTASTKLVSDAINRTGSFKISPELTDSVSQLQVNCQTWQTKGSIEIENYDKLKGRDIYTQDPKGILVIGNTKQLDNNEKRITFELFRKNIHNPEIITFDELYERAKFIVRHVSKS